MSSISAMGLGDAGVLKAFGETRGDMFADITEAPTGDDLEFLKS